MIRQRGEHRPTFAPRRFGRLATGLVFASLLAFLGPVRAAAQDARSNGGLAAGMALFTQHDLEGTDETLSALPADTPVRDRATALRLRALLAWRYRQDWQAAEGLIEQALQLGEGRSSAFASRSRLETARHQYDAAYEAALQAIAEAETRQEGVQATIRLAEAALAPAESSFDAAPGDALAPATAERLQEAHGRLVAAVGENPGDLELGRLLVRSSIFLGDGEALLAGWTSYYLTIVGQPDAGVLQAPKENLDALLPTWGASQATAEEALRVIAALARSGMLREAWFAAETPAWTQGGRPVETGPAAEERTQLLAYARFVHAGQQLTDEYYRQLALDEADTDQYRAAFVDLAEPLWDAIPWEDERPDLTFSNLIGEVDQRFHAQMRGGRTAGYDDLHFGHYVIDEGITVSQYGHEAELRFMALDGMVSNGFQSWAWDYRLQHGGWAGPRGMTQVRPAYADGGQEIWRLLSDSVALARRREQTARETERDWDRAAADPHAYLPGLAGRLRQQGVSQLLDELRGSESGEADLESRFLVAYEAAVFASSIVAHEGRHAIDRRLDDVPGRDLEFRAKLSEVAFAPHPRLAFGGIINGNIGDNTSHGRGNLQVMEGLVSWMEAHGDEIVGLDETRPLLPQLDLLSDEQLRAAMASMDPLAR